MLIRPANVHDVQAIHALICDSAEHDRMLFRSLADIYENLQTFLVAWSDQSVVGCCALEVVWADLADPPFGEGPAEPFRTRPSPSKASRAPRGGVLRAPTAPLGIPTEPGQPRPQPGAAPGVAATPAGSWAGPVADPNAPGPTPAVVATRTKIRQRANRG